MIEQVSSDDSVYLAPGDDEAQQLLNLILHSALVGGKSRLKTKAMILSQVVSLIQLTNRIDEP